MAHAPFSPSAATRWMTCPGSHLLSKALPDTPESDYAANGTRLHALAAEIIGTVTGTDSNAGDFDIWLSSEDTAIISPYIAHALTLQKTATAFYVEHEVHHPSHPGVYGTADLLAMNGTVLHVTDLKTGTGVQVAPEDNEQLLTYAWLALWGFPSAEQVCLTIVQPDYEGVSQVKEWRCTRARVEEHGVKLVEAMRVALTPDAPLVPGEHCRWCKVKPSCPALTGMARNALAVPALANLSPIQMSEWLGRADLLMTFIDGLRETAHQALRDGYKIPGYMLKPKRAMRQWAEEDVVLAYAREKKIRIFQSPKLMSPAMAEKAYPQGLPEPIKSQIVSVSSGTNVVRGDAPVEAEAPRTLQGALANLNYRV